MKAAQYDCCGGPDVIDILDVAEPVAGADQLLVKVEACALSPKDALTRAGNFARRAGPRGCDPRRVRRCRYAGRADCQGAGGARDGAVRRRFRRIRQ